MATEVEYDDPNAQPASDPVMGLRHSGEIDKIAEALAKAQGQFAKALKDSANPFFKSKYADLASVIGATREALSANGIALLQSPRLSGQQVTITTLLVHSSGQWISDDLAIPIADKITAQTVGSAVTYGRRYALQAFLGIAGEDDDGNAATGKPVIEGYAAEFDQRTEGQRTIADFQVRAWESALKSNGRTPAQIQAYLKHLGIEDVKDMLRANFNEAIKWAVGTEDLEKTLKTSVDTAKPKSKSPNSFGRLFAKATEHHISEEDMKTYAYEAYNVKSLTQLTTAQVQDLESWVEMQTA